MEIIQSVPVKSNRNKGKGKHTYPLPDDLKEESKKYDFPTTNALLKCDEQDVYKQLERYAVDPKYTLENIAQYFHIGSVTLYNLLTSEKYKEAYAKVKKAKAQMMIESGLSDIIETHSRISNGEDTHPSLVRSTELLAKYKMNYASMLDHELSGKRSASSDTNIQINVQTPFEVKDL